jgi:predicted Zn-dependent protease
MKVVFIAMTILMLGFASLHGQNPPPTTPPTPAEPASATTAKSGGRDCQFPDVENIGNRDINGRIYLFFPNFISYEREIQIGAEYAAQVQQSAKMLTIPEVNDYVDTLVQNLVRHSDAKVPFHVYLVDSDEVNAFALPGGYMFVNKGLIQAAETEDELVGVLCHEIGHVAARHATERLTKAELLQWASIPSIFVGGIGGIALRNAIGMALNLQILGITRGSEKEADILGSQYAWAAGFDPNGFVSFFEKLMAMEKKQPGKFASWFRTHPPTPERISYVQDEIDYCLPVKPKYIVTSSSFDEVKARLASYDNTLLAANKPSASGEKGKKEGKPTLKRRTDTDDTSGGEQTEPPAKPTLKKDDDPSKT